MLGVFAVLCITGLLSFFTDYTRHIATVHSFFGFLFTAVSLVHIFNNLKPIRIYIRDFLAIMILLLISGYGLITYKQIPIVKQVMDYGARSKVKIGTQDDESMIYKKIETMLGRSAQITLDLKKSKHFWHPQIAIWTEDTLGNYKETLFVTKATARGLFAGGRSKENFKSLDDASSENFEEGYRRVNALPVWSHKRGVVYDDGLYAPTNSDPLPDGITGATPLGNFTYHSSVDYDEDFVVKLEINVAFDDNEYYSEFDFPDDETFHNGTGQLGQPSLIYKSTVDSNTSHSNQIMILEGHGHHSAQNGILYADLSKMTTGLEIIDYAVVGYKK